MKENSKFKELSLEELITKYKQSKAAVIGLGIGIIIAVMVLIYLAVSNENYALIAVAIATSISFLPSIIVLKQIETEIKSRNS
jgi:hypothetical protein